MSDNARGWVQGLTTLLGLALVAFGIRQGVVHEGAWGLWPVVMSAGPIVLGVLLAVPHAVDRALDIAAPRIPFLHSHEED